MRSELISLNLIDCWSFQCLLALRTLISCAQRQRLINIDVDREPPFDAPSACLGRLRAEHAASGGVLSVFFCAAAAAQNVRRGMAIYQAKGKSGRDGLSGHAYSISVKKIKSSYPP